MNCYRIKNWNDVYENNRTRELQDLKWFPCPVKLSGDGYTLIMNEKDGPAIFGAWIACTEVAASCDPRGLLIRSAGIPHDAASIARQTRMPVKIINRTLSFCMTHCKWFELIDLQSGAVIPQEGAEIPPCIEGIEGKRRKGIYATFIPPVIEEVKKYFTENKYPEELATRFFKGYETAQWKDSHGKQIKNWKQKAQHVWFKPEAQIKSESQHPYKKL